MKAVAAALAAAVALAACAAVPPAPDDPGWASFDWFAYEGADPVPEGRPPGPDEYRNPVLAGFYPDPSIVAVGDDFYLVASTFAWFPGIPVFHSRDLVSWTQIGNAVDRPGQLDFTGLGMSRGVFAPAIEHRRGTFYILNTCVDCGGNFLLTARDPAGPWSDPVWLPELAGGIDPSLFFDEDGRAWIVNNGPPEGRPLYEGHRAIWIQEFDPDALRMKGPRRVLVDGGVDISKKPVWIEGPHIFRKDGFYYLIAAEGGTEEGHSQVVLRSRSVTGPYLPGPANPILTQRDLPNDRPFPVTSAGHADFVRTRGGEWWAAFLAVRPYRDGHFNTGRETFLLPVRWEDGWPRITAPGETIASLHRRPDLPRGRAPALPTGGDFAYRDDFAAAALAPAWMMARTPRARWYRLGGGRLALEPRREGLGDLANPSFLARRQQHLRASASTQMRFAPAAEGAEAGLAAFQNDEHWYSLALAREGGRLVLKVERRAGAGDPPGGTVLAAIPSPVAPGAPLRLRIEADGARYHFSWAAARGPWHPLLRDADGTVLSTKRAGGFVGALLGLHAYAP